MLNIWTNVHIRIYTKPLYQLQLYWHYWHFFWSAPAEFYMCLRNQWLRLCVTLKSSLLMFASVIRCNLVDVCMMKWVISSEQLLTTNEVCEQLLRKPQLTTRLNDKWNMNRKRRKTMQKINIIICLKEHLNKTKRLWHFKK